MLPLRACGTSVSEDSTRPPSERVERREERETERESREETHFNFFPFNLLLNTAGVKPLLVGGKMKGLSKFFSVSCSCSTT